LFNRLFQKPRTVHYLHIGKCGGTAVKDLAGRVNQLRAGLRIVAHGHSVKLKDLPPDAPYFFAIRNPVTRFYSAFYMRKRNEAPRLFREWSEGERAAYERFPEANDLAESLFGGMPLAGHAFAAMRSIGHMTYQHLWFDIGDLLKRRPPVGILRQEKLAEDVAALLRTLGIASEVSLPENPTRARRNDYSSTPPPSAKAIENLERWYAADIEYYRLLNDWIESSSPMAREPGSGMPKWIGGPGPSRPGLPE